MRKYWESCEWEQGIAVYQLRYCVRDKMCVCEKVLKGCAWLFALIDCQHVPLRCRLRLEWPSSVLATNTWSDLTKVSINPEPHDREAHIFHLQVGGGISSLASSSVFHLAFDSTLGSNQVRAAYNWLNSFLVSTMACSIPTLRNAHTHTHRHTHIHTDTCCIYNAWMSIWKNKFPGCRTSSKKIFFIHGKVIKYYGHLVSWLS